MSQKIKKIRVNEHMDAPVKKLKQLFTWLVLMIAFFILVGGIFWIISDFSWTNLMVLLIGLLCGPFVCSFSFFLSFAIFFSPVILIKWLSLKKYSFKLDDNHIIIKNKSKKILDTEVSNISSIDFEQVNIYTGSYSSSPILEGDALGDFMRIIYRENSKDKKVELNLNFLLNTDKLKLHQFMDDVLARRDGIKNA